MPNDLEYEEDRPAGIASHEVFVSSARASSFYRSTQKALKWIPSPSGEAPRTALPLLAFECCLIDCPVFTDWATWTTANGYGVVETCLNLDHIKVALDFAEDHGVLVDSAGNPIVYDTQEEVAKAFTQMYADHPDEDDLKADADAWINLEALASAASINAYAWLNRFDIATFVRNTAVTAGLQHETREREHDA